MRVCWFFREIYHRAPLLIFKFFFVNKTAVGRTNRLHWFTQSHTYICTDTVSIIRATNTTALCEIFNFLSEIEIEKVTYSWNKKLLSITTPDATNATSENIHTTLKTISLGVEWDNSGSVFFLTYQNWNAKLFSTVYFFVLF